MQPSIHQRIQRLVEETSDAFSAYGNINADYAEFATMALSEFKTAMRNPLLTERELKELLRHGTSRHRQNAPETAWAAFIATYMVRNVNMNEAV